MKTRKKDLVQNSFPPPGKYRRKETEVIDSEKLRKRGKEREREREREGEREREIETEKRERHRDREKIET